MKRLYPTVILLLTLFTTPNVFAQVTLGPSPYNQNFNSIGSSGLPTGFTVRTGSTAIALGVVQGFATTPQGWNTATGAFKNFASGTGLTSNASLTQQNASTNRSLGVRQAGSFGDPGAAFVLQLANTTGRTNFQLSFKLQSLDSLPLRVTTWRVDYGFGPAPTTFTAASATGTLTTGGLTFTNNTINVNFGSSLDNQSGNVWIRIVTVTPSTGSNTRATTAIDDFSLSYSSGSSGTPSLTVIPTAIVFGNQALGTSSVTKPYTFNYSNLDSSNVNISTHPPFSISKSAGGPFSSNISFTHAELNGTSDSVFTRFSPTNVGSKMDTIKHTGGGLSGSVTVLLTGTGVSLSPVAVNDAFSGTFGNLISGNVSLNDSDPQSHTLTYHKLTDPPAGTLTFNNNGSFTYQSVVGSASPQTFTYRVTNTDSLSADATVTISLAEQSKIFISQYYEGTSVNKWIELTNPTSSPVNTASPQLKLGLYSISGDAGNIVISGNPTQVMNLNITIPAKSSVLIGNTGNGAEVPYLTAASAQQSSNSVINFNGNDGVALLDATNSIVDAFGTGVNAKDVSYVRNQDATTPSTSFIVNDWTRTPLATVQNAADLDDANRLGVHVQPELPPCVSPTTQPSTLTFSAVGTKTITLNFNASPDAGEYLIVRSLNDSLNAVPSDSTLYNAGNSLGSGTVAARISGTSFTDNNLLPGTTFYYFIFALNNISCDGGPRYLVSNPLIGTQATNPLPVCFTPASQPNNFRITFSNYNLIQGAFDASNADEFLVVMSEDSILNSLPVNQAVYSVGDTLGGGIVIKRAAQTTFSRTGLAQDTKYFFFVFAVNSNCSGGPLYLTASPLTGTRRTGILDPNALNYYFGNLHSHSSYSDGNKDDLTKTPVEDYAFAKNSRKMDFLGISEHNHTQAGMRLANWQPGIEAAQNATTSTFVALHGMEWGVISGGGHVVVYGIDSLIGWEPGEHQIFVPKNTYTGPTGLFSIINRHGLNAIATLAHPNTSDYNNIGASYNALADSAIVGSALESGPAFSTNLTYSDPPSSMSYLNYYNLMLSRGYHLGANMDHDNHNMTFGRHTRGRLVVLAPALTENDLLDAMKRMRFYASEDSAARVSFTINDQLIGSRFSGNGKPHISVSGSTTSPITNITIKHGIPGSGILPTTLASSPTATLSFTDSTLTHLATGYYYADITEADGSRIITSPIWYTRNDSIKSTQTITFNALSVSTYGDEDIDPAASSTNATIPIVYTSGDSAIATIVAGKVRIVNTGSVMITASQAGNEAYLPASAQQLLVINKALLTVTARDTVKVSGTQNPPFTLMYAGFKGTETAAVLDSLPVAITTATVISPPGTYPITPIGGSGRNYAFQFVGGVLTVTGVLPNVYVTTPVDGATGQKTKLTLTSKALTGALTYTIEISPVINFSSGVRIKSGTRSQIFDSLAYNTTYYARVKTNLNPTYGKITTFTTIAAELLSYVTSPIDSAVNQKVSLSITANIVPLAVHYTIELNTASNFSGTSIVKTGGRTQSFTGLSYNTTYYSRVRTEFTSNWGATRKFTTVGAVTTNYVVTPANNAINQSTNLNITANTVLNATEYTIQLSESSTFDTIAFEVTGSTRVLAFTGLKYNQHYYNRVSTNVTPAFGLVRSFTTKTAESLAFVTSPADNAIDRGTTLTINSNIVPDATEYRIQLSESQTFDSIAFEVTSSTRMLSFTGLKYNTRYYNRVRTNLSPIYGAVRSFVTRTAESLSYVTSPSDDSVDRPTTLKVTSNSVPGATYYTIQLSETADFDSIAFERTSTSPIRYVTFTGLKTGTQYFNRVSTDLSPGHGIVKSFTTLGIPPGARMSSNSEPDEQLAQAAAGAEELMEFDVRIYPNPFREKLTLYIESRVEKQAIITLMDVNGKAVHESTEQTNATVEIQKPLSSGVYLLRVISGTQQKAIRVIKTD